MDEKTTMTKNNEKSQLAEKRHREILDAARHIFAEKGYRVTTIDDIANYLTVGKGTIYRYFANKEALFIAVFEDGMEQLMTTMYSHIEAVVNPADKIRCAIGTFFEFFDENPELVEIGMQVRSEFKDDYRRIFLEVYSDYIVKIQETIRAGINTGVFRNLDVEKTSEAFSAMLHGVLQDFYVREFGPDGGIAKKELLTDKIDAVTSLLMEGLLERGNK